MRTFLIYLSCILLISSCARQMSSTKTSINLTSSVERRTLTPTMTTKATAAAILTATRQPTFTPMIINTKTPTSTKPVFPSPEPNSTITQRCVDINSNLNANSEIDGILIFGNGQYGGKPYMIDLKSNRINDYSFTEGNTQLFLQSAAVSPDGKWLAYIEWFQKANISRLHLMSSDLLEKPYLDLPSGWGRILYWLDNQRLLLSTFQTLPEGIYPSGKMMILSPFEREWEILAPKLPFQISIDPSPWNSSDNPIVIYNASLTRAVYLALSGFYLIDAKSMNVITHISTQAYGSRPQWSPQGDHFAMLIDKADFPEMRPEIYQFNQEGQSKPITNLAEAFKNNSESIENFSWSPDGSMIAFSYFVKDFQDEHIAVVNVSTGQIIDYCVQSLGSLPIWSPDGQKIAFASARKIDVESVEIKWRTVILDIEKEYAVQVADTMLPLGWMDSP